MPRESELLQRALLESNLKLGPQGQMLRQMLSELAGSYSRTRKVNTSNEIGIKQATRQARPDVSAAFDQALSSASAQRAALGMSGDPQASAYQRRVGEQRANALSELSDREVRATEGRIYANQSARDEYMGGKQKIQGQLMGLAEQAGDLTASTLGDLEDKERAAALTRRGQNITARGQTLSSRDRRAALAQREQAAEQREAAAARPKSKVKWATPQQHASAKDEIEQAVAVVRQQQARGVKSRAEIIRLLTTGRPKRKVEVDGKEVEVPEIPRLSADYVRAAMNLVADGSLSRGDLQRLHNRGLQTRRLGYELRPPQGPRPNRAARGATPQGTRGGGTLSRRPPVPGLTR